MKNPMTKPTYPRPHTALATLPFPLPITMLRLTFAAATAALLLCAVHPLHAQYSNASSYPNSQDTQDAQQISQLVDPPSRVGRVSLLQGNVSFQPANVQDFSAAELNYPLTTGDRLYTDGGGRAELEAGQLSVRLGAATDFTVTTLSDELAQFGLALGSVHVRPYALEADTTLEVDTPNASITILQPGDVRVDVSPEGNGTLVTVFSGQVQVNADGVQQVVQGGQSFQVTGANPSQAQFVRRQRPDALDQFSAQRDAMDRQQYAAQGQYVNTSTIGYTDLGQYGDWDSSGADDGSPVWYPRDVAADWAPYRVGHWAFINPWGWTWVESEPWGFAPFHYGRWARFGGRWGWVPGPPVIRPVYSPALVVFVGGANFRIGGSGNVTAWFPLGPREVYQPWYHSSPAYINRVNVTNIYSRNTAEVRNIYNNRTTNVYAGRMDGGGRGPGGPGGGRDFGGPGGPGPRGYANREVATTAVPQERFASGRPVGPNVLHVDPHQFDNAPVNQRPPMSPPRPVVGGGGQSPRALPPVQSRPVLAGQDHGNNPGGGRAPNGGSPNGGQPGNGQQGGGFPRNGLGYGGGQQPRTYPGQPGQPSQPQPGNPAGAGAPVFPGRNNGQPAAPTTDGRSTQPVPPNQPTGGAKPPVPVRQPNPGYDQQRPDQQRPVQQQPTVPAGGVENPGFPGRRTGQLAPPPAATQTPAQPTAPTGGVKAPAPVRQDGPRFDQGRPVQQQPSEPAGGANAPAFPQRRSGVVDQPRQQVQPQQPAPQPQPQRPAPQPAPQPQPQRPAPQPAPQPQRPAPQGAAQLPSHPMAPHAEDRKPDDKKK